MKCELFSMLSSEAEVEELNSEIYNLLSQLKTNNFDLAYKTEIKLDKYILEKALTDVSLSEDRPEVIFVANALSTTDYSSFISLFEQIIKNNEKHLGIDIVVNELGDFGNGMLGFYFVYNNVDVIVLPQSNLSGNSSSDMIFHSIDILLNNNYINHNQDANVDYNKIDNIKVNNQEFDNKADNNQTNNKSNYINKNCNNPNTKQDKNKNKSKKQNNAKKPFLKTLIPQKEDSKSIFVSKVLTIIFAILFLISAILLANELLFKSLKNKNDIEKLYSNSSYSNQSNPYSNSDYTTDLRTKDWVTINSLYPDIVSWIQINNTEINYPVLYSTEKDGNGDFYYLYRNYKKEHTKYGSVFIDPRNYDKLNNRVTIMHGHHMIDNSMFSDLVSYGKYSGNLDFYKKAPVVNIETPEGVTRWQIFSVVKTTVEINDSSFFDYCATNFDSDEEFMEYIYKVKVRSLFDVPICINEDDKIICLSTCSYEYSNFRTLVFARQLRYGESPTLSTNQTTLNSYPLWPDKYYTSTGLQKPTYSNFATDYQAGKISWYDGDLYN